MIYLLKSQPAPASLAIEKTKPNGSYKQQDVLDAIKADFKNKCYICGFKGPTSINVEHFFPHRDANVDLKFDWNNLFYACSRCNNLKGAYPLYDNILNCTDPNDEVDKKIAYTSSWLPKERPVFTAQECSEKVQNTIMLLNSVFLGTTPLKKLEAASLCDHLSHEIRKFADLVWSFYEDGYTPDEIDEIRQRIIRELRPTSSFTAFKRWWIKGAEATTADFGLYC